MLKILFLIHDLGQGGAEKVLVNLVNNIDRSKFEVTVVSLFGRGVNEQFLNPDIEYRSVFSCSIPGNSKIMKIFSPMLLHKLMIHEYYDIEVSYLEGPSARIISGCCNKKTKLVAWIHSEQHTMETLAMAFRNERESRACYGRFDRIVAVSQGIYDDFCRLIDCYEKCEIIYNTVEVDFIRKQALLGVSELNWSNESVRIIAVGTLKKAKGYDRLLRIIRRLKIESYKLVLFILGIGPMESEMREYIEINGLNDEVKLLGYQKNPYNYIAKSDMFVCASYSEGFSTATTEALIVGTPVCTVDVGGMREMLGEHDEYGIVTDNNEEGLYYGIKRLLDNPDLLNHYRKQAIIRGEKFSVQETVVAVQNMFNEVSSKE